MKRDDVPEGLDYGRRRFLGSAAMTAAHLGMFGSPSPLGGFGPPSTLRGFGETGTAEAQDCVPRELAAIGRATDAIWRAFSNRYCRLCISSMREVASATIVSEKASTRSPRGSFNDC
jgi:hypothetical protein